MIKKYYYHMADPDTLAMAFLSYVDLPIIKPYVSHHREIFERAKADIGWRLCKNESPAEKGQYFVAWSNLSKSAARWDGERWFVRERDQPIKWCKLPEPFDDGK